MNLLIASDIHGDLGGMENILRAADAEHAEKILLLGDLLYHGPRNDLPPRYAPKKVIALLNENARRILAVRGNCDTEVDQMVLDFPILADYAYLDLQGLRVFATHGHRFSGENPPPLLPGELLLQGHTHIPGAVGFGENNCCLNPGSASIPKGGHAPSYMIFRDSTFVIKTFNRDVIAKISYKRNIIGGRNEVEVACRKANRNGKVGTGVR